MTQMLHSNVKWPKWEYFYSKKRFNKHNHMTYECYREVNKPWKPIKKKKTKKHHTPVTTQSEALKSQMSL